MLYLIVWGPVKIGTGVKSRNRVLGRRGPIKGHSILDLVRAVDVMEVGASPSPELVEEAETDLCLSTEDGEGKNLLASVQAVRKDSRDHQLSSSEPAEGTAGSYDVSSY